MSSNGLVYARYLAYHLLPAQQAPVCVWQTLAANGRAAVARPRREICGLIDVIFFAPLSHYKHIYIIDFDIALLRAANK